MYRQKITLITVSLLISITTFAQGKGVVWENKTFSQVLQSIQKSDKLIFMDCYAVWCGPCKHMANNVFTLKKAGNYFNKKFVNMKIDMEKGEGIDLKKRYNVSLFPTFLIIDRNGEEIGRIVGAKELDDFIVEVEKASNIENSSVFRLAKFKETKASHDAFAYLQLTKSAMRSDLVNEFFRNYYDELDERTQRSPDLWPFIVYSLSLKDDWMFNKMIADKFFFDRYYGKATVDATLVETIREELKSYLKGDNSLNENRVIEVCNILKMLYEKPLDLLLIQVSTAVTQSDYESVAKLFGTNLYYSLTPIELSDMKRIFMNMKNISTEEKQRFLTMLCRIYASEGERVKKELEKSSFLPN